MDDVLAVCDLGHQFVLKDFEPESEVIASISWCPEMVAREDHFGLVLECGARVLWVRGGLTIPARRFMFKRHRSEQLDLFDQVEEIDPLTKLTE